MTFDWVSQTIDNIRDYSTGRNNVLYLIIADKWTRNAEKHGAPYDIAVLLRAAVQRLSPRAGNDCYAEMRRHVRESTAMAENGDLAGARGHALFAMDYADGFLRFSKQRK